MSKAARAIIYIIGIFSLALGTVLFTRSHLGVSAIVSVPYTLSQIAPITLGMCTSIVYGTFVIIEVLLYRCITLRVVLQLPFSVLFGLIIDFYNTVLTINPRNWLLQAACLVFAVIATAMGICLMLKANFIVNPPDGMVQAVSAVLKLEFGTAKWLFDFVMVVLAAGISWICTGRILGIGIGTIVAVFTIGNSIRLIDTKIMSRVTV